MTYRFYHEIRKGRAPKNAPSYIDEEETPAATPMDTTAAESGENGGVPSADSSITKRTPHLRNCRPVGNVRFAVPLKTHLTNRDKL